MAVVEVTQTGLITGEALATMGDRGRCELAHGRIVPKRPTGYEHGEIENAIGAEDDHVPGDDVLPGFSVPVARLFDD